MRRRSVLKAGGLAAGLGLAGVLAPLAHSQSGAQGAPAASDLPLTPPVPGAPRPSLAVHSMSETLANGLRVIVVPRPGVALVSAALLIRSGSEVDPDGRAGLADLAATLLTRGTTTRSAPRIAQDADALGGSLDSGAGWDRSRIAITVTRARLPAALDLMADVALNPRFAPAEIERARRQALDGLRVAYSEPGTLAQMVAVRSLFGNGIYGTPRLGTPASLARITRADLAALHTAWYRPDNAILVLAGDIAPADGLGLARRSLGAWARPAAPLATLASVRRATVAGASGRTVPPLALIDLPGAGQAGVVAIMPAVTRAAPDYYSGMVASTVLGGSSSSRLAVEIRVKRGLTYDARSSLDARRVAGLELASVQTNNPSAPEVVGLIRTEVQRLATSPVAPAELAARVARLVGSYGRSLETTAGLAARVSELALHEIDLDEINRAVARLQAVTAADVQGFAARHWPLSALRFAVVGAADAFAPALQKEFPDSVLLPAARLDLEQPGLVR